MYVLSADYTGTPDVQHSENQKLHAALSRTLFSNSSFLCFCFTVQTMYHNQRAKKAMPRTIDSREPARTSGAAPFVFEEAAVLLAAEMGLLEADAALLTTEEAMLFTEAALLAEGAAVLV
jgi:hypothetical protein